MIYNRYFIYQKKGLLTNDYIRMELSEFVIMNICLVMPYHPDLLYGGPESVAYNTVQGFKSIHKRLLDENINIIVLSDKGTKFTSEYVEDNTYSNIKYIFYKRLKSSSLTGDLQTLIKILQLKNIDIVHSHSPQSAVAGVLYKKITILTLHGIVWRERKFSASIFENFTYSLHTLRIKWLKNHINKLIAISPYVIDEFNIIGGIDQDRYTIIENPISDSFFQINREMRSNNLIICPGSINRRKNQETLIKAIAQVNKQGLDCKAIFTGSISDKEYHKYLNKLIAKLDLDNNISIMGSIPPDILKDLYSKASLLCLTSLQETSPMAIAEAMASGLPVIAPDVGGVKYMITHGKDGIIVKPDDVNSIASNLIYLLESKNLMDSFAHKGKITAEMRWKSSTISNKLLDLYLQYM